MHRCRFGVHVGGGVVRLFLCHHLRPPSLTGVFGYFTYKVSINMLGLKSATVLFIFSLFSISLSLFSFGIHKHFFRIPY